MAKKSMKKEFKNLFSEFAEKSMEVITATIAKINIAEFFSNLLHIKAKLRKYFAMHILTTAGTIILLLGLVTYLKQFYVVLNNGIGEMIIGAVLLIASLIIYLIKR